MKIQTLTKALISAGLIMGTMSAVAAPVSLGSIEHLYGSNTGHQAPSVMGIYHPGGNCDTLNNTTVTVKATAASSCNRFADAFDFSGIDYGSIDHFTMTLDFNQAKNQSAWFGFVRVLDHTRWLQLQRGRQQLWHPERQWRAELHLQCHEVLV